MRRYAWIFLLMLFLTFLYHRTSGHPNIDDSLLPQIVEAVARRHSGIGLGDIAPPLPVTGDNESHGFSPYRDQDYTVLIFGASYCEATAELLEYLATWQQLNRDVLHKVRIFAVSSEEGGTVRSWQQRVAVPVVWDKWGLVDTFHVSTYPTTFIIDSGGKVRAVIPGRVILQGHDLVSILLDELVTNDQFLQWEAATPTT